MKSDSDNFESLRRLLALKRYEQAPPGYFQNFSGRVIARIEAGERGEGARGLRTWAQHLWDGIERWPVVAGAFGAAVLALLVAGMFNPEQPIAATPGPVGQDIASVIRPSAMPATPDVRLISNTNSSVEGLFNDLQIRVQRVGGNVDLLSGR